MPYSLVDPYPELESTLGAVALRVVPIAHYPRLADLVASGLFPDGAVTLGGWFDPTDDLSNARSTLAHQATSFIKINPSSWRLPLGVYLDDQLVGVQGLAADDFPVLGAPASGSWLAPGARGRGVGTTARQIIVSICFELLGAQEARTSALTTNAASLRVSEKLGYQRNGTTTISHHGHRATLQHLLLTRAVYEQRPRPAVEHQGWTDILAAITPTQPRPA